MAIKLVVLDMAGTTVLDNSNVHDALIKGFAAQNLVISYDDANGVMGIPKPVAIRTLLTEKFAITEGIGSLTTKIHETFLHEMISFYKTDPGVKGTNNAEETFAQLREKGIKVCLDTGFSRDIADTIIERLNWKDKIDLSVTSDEVNNGRPFPDMILKAMDICNITDPAEVAKVGDTASDMQEGTAANCKYVIGITTGAFKREDLEKEKHTHLINNLLEVLTIVA